MDETKQIILEALSKLDPGNDEHWTNENLPTQAIIMKLTGTTYTRAQITDAAPEFSRENTDLPHFDDATGTTTDEPAKVFGEDDASRLAQVEDEIKELEDEASTIDRKRTALLKERDALVSARDAKNPKAMTEIRRFLEQQKLNRAARAEANPQPRRKRPAIVTKA